MRERRTNRRESNTVLVSVVFPVSVSKCVALCCFVVNGLSEEEKER